MQAGEKEGINVLSLISLMPGESVSYASTSKAPECLFLHRDHTLQGITITISIIILGSSNKACGKKSTCLEICQEYFARNSMKNIWRIQKNLVVSRTFLEN